MTCVDHSKGAEVKSGIPKPELEGILQFCCWRRDVVAREILMYPATERSQSPMTGNSHSLYNRKGPFEKSPGHLINGS